MNALDIILLAAFIPAVWRGLKKGFLEQFLMLAGLVLGVWAAYRFSSLMCSVIRPHIDESDTMISVLGFVLVLVLVVLAVFLIAKLLTRVIKTTFVGWVDKLLGVVAGILVTGIVLSALIISFDSLNQSLELYTGDYLQKSHAYNILKDVGYKAFPYLKNLLMKA